MSLEIFNITKKIKGKMYMLKAENMLMTGNNMSPKICFTLVNPPPEGATSNKHIFSKNFIDVKEALLLINHVYRGNGEDADLLKSFKGSHDKQLNKIVSRVLTVTKKVTDAGKVYFTFTSDTADGEQVYVQNSKGEQVPGIVKAKAGGEKISHCSVGLTRDEMLYVVDMLRMELQAWRTTLCTDAFYHPEKYRYNSAEEKQ